MDSKSIATRLLTQAHVRIQDLPELKVPATREEVRHRLAEVGYELVEPVYSEYYSARPENRDDDALTPTASNLGLRENEAAMLVILWCKLAYPARVEGHPGPHRIQPETIRSEFASSFGGDQQVRAAMTRLENLEFVTKLDGYYVAGPAMESLLDGSKMVDFVNHRAILVEARDRVLKLMDDRKLSVRDVVQEYLKSTNDWFYPRDVTSELKLPAEEVRAAILELHHEGKLHKEGTGKARRYRRIT